MSNDDHANAEIAINSENKYLRREAIEKIKDQDLIAYTLINAKYGDIGFWGAKKLSAETLVEVVEKAKVYNIRMEALGFITDQSALAKIAKSPSSKYQSETDEHIDDGVTIFKTGRTIIRDLRIDAVAYYIDDKNILADVMQNAASVEVRNAAKDKSDKIG
jgi:hypothetical protein